MLYKRTLALALVGCLLAVPVSALEVDSGGQYCFGSGDFAGGELVGLCVTGLPDKELGAVYLEAREIRQGDVLTAEQLNRLTFRPLRRESDAQATLTYLPVFADGVGEQERVTISIRGRENLPPVAEDFAAETYKNLPLEGHLKVREPEGEAMTFTLVRQPKRGQVEIREDGSFTYTPKKNKVGIDSFVYTASDDSGKTSRETTVTITIVKPTDSTQYTDTVGTDCRFAAEWMKNTGIFVGEKLDGNACFRPERNVSRGEFLAMLVRTLDIPAEDGEPVWGEEIPGWLQPYLSAALRSGLTAGVPQDDYNAPITGLEAAAMIENALDLPVAETMSLGEDALTRGDAALALYETFRLAQDAPGMALIRRQK